MRIYLIA